MIKKICILTIACVMPSLFAETSPAWFEIKPSYFLFSTCPMSDIYDDGFEIQGSVSAPLWNCLNFYGSIGYRTASGRALNTGERTSLTVVPIDIGIKPIFNFCERFYYFFATGPRFFYLHQHNNSPYVDCRISGGDVGFFINTGFNVQFTDCVLLGIFGEYSYEKTKVCSKRKNVYSSGDVQIGGFAFGASIGFVF